jgi:hypothetical protein
VKTGPTSQPPGSDEQYQEEVLALLRGIDYTWPAVFTGSWVLLSALLPTALGAFIGAAATGRNKGRAVAAAFGSG